METYSFGKAKIEDAIRISVLLKTVYIETYGTEGITFESANFIEKRFSINHIEQTIRKNPDQLIIAYCHGNPIGVAEIFFETSCPIRKMPVSELDKLYVLKKFHGKRIGYHLMLEIEKLLKEKGYTELNIEVYVENNRAISFYKRLEFQIIGEVDFPMETNVYKNWVMHKHFL